MVKCSHSISLAKLLGEHSKQGHDNASTSPIYNQELLDQLLTAMQNIALPSTQHYHPMIGMCPFTISWYIEVPHEHSGAVVGVVNYSRTFVISPVGLTGEKIAKGSILAIGWGK